MSDNEENGEWIKIEKKKNTKSANTNKGLQRKTSSGMDGRSFESGRPKETSSFLRDEEITDDDDDDEDKNEENIVLESPMVWNQFALIGEINSSIQELLMHYQILPSSEIERLHILGKRIIDANWMWKDETDCENDLLYYAKSVDREFHFISVIPQFTMREYGSGKMLFFVHVRYDTYFLAENKPIRSYDININSFFGFLGERFTHDPISIASKEVDDNKKNFLKIMKIVDGKMKHDKFQEAYEEESDKSENRPYYDPISKEDLKKYENSIYNCKLHLEDNYSGYGIILKESHLERKIYLSNRRNCFQAFNGDIVDIIVFQQSQYDASKKKRNTLSTEHEIWSGRVIRVQQSEVKPVNKIFLCKLTFGNSNLMIPICKTIPVIKVDNKEAESLVKKNCYNLLEGLKDVSGIENLIREHIPPEHCKKFADQYFVTLKTLKKDLGTDLNRIQYVDSYRCEFIFLVLYRTWDSDSQFPFGEVVGLYTPDASFAKSLPLISVSCDLSVVGIETEGELKAEVRKIKIEKAKRSPTVKMDQNDPKSSKTIFCIKYSNQPYNEVAYSYESMDSVSFKIGVHVVNVSKYVKQDCFLDKYALKQFYTFLLPVCRPAESEAKAHYLFSETLTNGILSINKTSSVSVISFYFLVKSDTFTIEGVPIFKFEEILLNEEFDAEIIDEIVERKAFPYEYLNNVFQTCMNNRTKRIRSHRIPPDWFYPDFMLKMNFCAFVISSEMDVLVNGFVKNIFSKRIEFNFPVTINEKVVHESKLHSWKREVLDQICIKYHPTLHKLFKFLNLNNNNVQNVSFSSQLLDMVPERRKVNLFKCDMLFPDVSFYFYKLENIVTWNVICARSDSENFPYSVSITKPLSCFNDLLLQRLLSIYDHEDDFHIYTNEEIFDICDSYNDNKKIYDKYWNICRSYEIKDRFQKCSFILDCVYDDFTEDSILFHHPFLRDVYHDNFILFEYIGLSNVKIPSDKETGNVELEWQTKIFINDNIIYREFVDRKIVLTDVNIYQKPIWRPNLFVQEITDHDIIRINGIKSQENKYPVYLTSETSKYMDTKIFLSLKLQKRQILKVQFNYGYNAGIMKIVPELLIVNPHLKVCLCHRNDPFKYFIHPNELSKINYRRFSNVQDYKHQFRILNQIEGVQQTISEKTSFFIHDVKITWIASKVTDEEHDIYGVVYLDDSWCKERFIKFGHKNLRIQDPVNTFKKAVENCKMEYLACIQTFLEEKNVNWLGHARVSDMAYVGRKNDVKVHITFKLIHSSFPLKPEKDQLYSFEIMATSITSRILDRNLRKLQEDSIEGQIVMKRILNKFVPVQSMVKYDTEIKQQMIHPFKLDAAQNKALNLAINHEFSLIWGPPGTGKTMVGCIIAFAYTCISKDATVLYCGPSNQSVDVVAEKMMKTFGDRCPRLLRIFSGDVMNMDFPYPGAVVNDGCSETPEFLKPITLHHIIRLPGKPFATKFEKYQRYFLANELKNPTSRKEYSKKVFKYQMLTKKAFQTEIKDGNYQIVLCTTVGSCKKLVDDIEITQVIIDESGMCTEPEALGPILNREFLRNIVFIGDHKQLRPIVTSQAAQGKMFNNSLFERICNPKKNYCTMLDTQYRMHPSICEFPSFNFYKDKDSKLITALSESWTGIPSSFIENISSFNGLQYVGLKGNYKMELRRNNVEIADNLWRGIRKRDFYCYPRNIDFGSKTPVKEKILFINVEGYELNQAVSGVTGHVKSKGNELEVRAVGVLYKKLIQGMFNKETASKSVMIITQYRLQEHLLRNRCTEILLELKVPGPPLVSTVVKSQGSECDYVIFSTVRSLPHRKDIDLKPSAGWIAKYLGFITDKNQFNVAITRAKKGLFIIGNSNLLSVNQQWKNMIDDLQSRGCIELDIFNIN